MDGSLSLENAFNFDFSNTKPRSPKAVDVSAVLPAALKKKDVDAWYLVKFAPGQIPAQFDGGKLRLRECIVEGGGSTSSSDTKGVALVDLKRGALCSTSARRENESNPKQEGKKGASSKVLPLPKLSPTPQETAAPPLPFSAAVEDAQKNSYLVFLPAVKDKTSASKALVPTPVRHVLEVTMPLAKWTSGVGAEFRLRPAERTGGLLSTTSGGASSTKKRKKEEGASSTKKRKKEEGGSSSEEEISLESEEEFENAAGSKRRRKGASDNEEETVVDCEGQWLTLSVLPTGDYGQNSICVGRMLCPIVCDGTFVGQTNFKRVDYGSGSAQERKLIGTWSQFSVQYESKIQRHKLDNCVGTEKYYAAARLDDELVLFPTELHNLRACVPEDEQLLLETITDTFAMDAQTKSARYQEFHERFAAAKRLRKLRNAQGKVVSDDRVEGDLAQIKETVSQTAKALDRANVEGNPHVANARKYLPEWNPKPKNSKDVWRAGLDKVFPMQLISQNVFLGKDNDLLDELWAKRSKSTKESLRKILGNGCLTGFDLVNMLSVASETQVKTQQDAQYLAKTVVLLSVMIEMYSRKRFSFSGARHEVRREFDIFENYDSAFRGAPGGKGGKAGKKGKGKKKGADGAGGFDSGSDEAPGDGEDKPGSLTYSIGRPLKDHLISQFYDCETISTTHLPNGQQNVNDICTLNKDKLLLHLALFLMQKSPNGKMNYASLEEDVGIHSKHQLRSKFEYMCCEMDFYPSSTVTLGARFEPLDQTLKDKKDAERKGGKRKGGGGKKGRGKGKGKKKGGGGGD